jgi:hypothetical protein
MANVTNFDKNKSAIAVSVMRLLRAKSVALDVAGA